MGAISNMQIDYKEKLWEVYESVGQHFINLMVSLLAMVIVARSFTLSGFGTFSYLVGVYHIASFLSEAGICDLFRNRYALVKDGQKLLRESAAALFCTGVITVVFFLTSAVYATAHSPIEESMVAYILIGVAIPLRNGNFLRTTLLHVSGKHREISRLLVKKHLLFLGLVWLLSTVQIPSLLVGSFFLSELYLRFSLRKVAKIKGIFQHAFFRRSYQTIRKALPHLFSGEALNLIFHADLFILGLYVHSAELGVYGEAALLGRLFLLVPVAIRPILHRSLSRLVAAAEPFTFSKSVIVVRAYLFYAHALLALLLLVYFDDIVHFIFALYGTEATSYSLFIIMLPGFLYYSAAIVHEAALEASGQAPFLSRISAGLLGLNVVLNFYFIPFAGVQGAATSTLFCLLIYFFTLGMVKITTFSKPPLLEFLTGGAVVYLVQKLINLGDPPFYVFALGVPPLLFLTFYLLTIFDVDSYQTISEPRE